MLVGLIILGVITVVEAIVLIWSLARKPKNAHDEVTALDTKLRLMRQALDEGQAAVERMRELRANLDKQIEVRKMELIWNEAAAKSSQEKTDEAEKRNAAAEQRKAQLEQEIKRLETEGKAEVNKRLGEFEESEKGRLTAEVSLAVAQLKEEYRNCEMGVESKRGLLKELEDRCTKLEQAAEKLALTKAEAERRQAVDAGKGSSIEMAPEDAADAEVLRRTSRGMRCANAVLKATFDVYVKPGIERVIRNEGAAGVSGIYRIYRKEGEREISYVGQAVDIGERWKTHAKRAWGVDDTGRIVLYREMMRTGIEEWKWEILEVVEDNALLSEREVYWGGFYGVKELGLNKKLG